MAHKSWNDFAWDIGIDQFCNHQVTKDVQAPPPSAFLSNVRFFEESGSNCRDCIRSKFTKWPMCLKEYMSHIFTYRAFFQHVLKDGIPNYRIERYWMFNARLLLDEMQFFLFFVNIVEFQVCNVTSPNAGVVCDFHDSLVSAWEFLAVIQYSLEGCNFVRFQIVVQFVPTCKLWQHIWYVLAQSRRIFCLTQTQGGLYTWTSVFVPVFTGEHAKDTFFCNVFHMGNMEWILNVTQKCRACTDNSFHILVLSRFFFAKSKCINEVFKLWAKFVIWWFLFCETAPASGLSKKYSLFNIRIYVSYRTPIFIPRSFGILWHNNLMVEIFIWFYHWIVSMLQNQVSRLLNLPDVTLAVTVFVQQLHEFWVLLIKLL